MDLDIDSSRRQRSHVQRLLAMPEGAVDTKEMTKGIGALVLGGDGLWLRMVIVGGAV